MVTCTETQLWISQPNWYLFYKYKKLLSQKQNLCVDKSSQTNIFTIGWVCSNILYCEHGVSFLLAPSRIHVQAHPWTAMWRLWVRDDVTIVAIDFEWKNVTQTMRYETYVMTYVATQSSLDDFPLWIRLGLDPDRVSSETRSGSKPSL